MHEEIQTYHHKNDYSDKGLDSVLFIMTHSVTFNKSSRGKNIVLKSTITMGKEWNFNLSLISPSSTVRMCEREHACAYMCV